MVDPPFAIETVLAEADRLGVRIVRVLETHTHADHVSGHGRLALDHGIPVSIHPAAEVAYPNDPLDDGDEVTVGTVKLRCLHTPGHRPEHCCLAVIDTTRADEPWLVLTGDSLFVGDTARPDLAVGRDGGRGRALPLAPPAPRAARRRRGLPRARGRLAVRQGDELPRLDDHRVRAPVQPDGLDPRAGRVRRGIRGRVRPEAAEPGTDRRAQPRPLPGRATAAARAAGPGRRVAASRRAPGRRPPRGPPPRSGRRSRLRHELLDEGRLRARCGPARYGARLERGGGRARDRRPALRRVPRHRRVRPRRRRGDDRPRWASTSSKA